MGTSGSYGETNRVLRTGDTMSGPLTIGRLVGTDLAFQAVTAGDTSGRIQFLANGTIQWSDGTNPADTDLFRSAAGVLRTTNQFSIYRVGEAANAELRLSTDAGFMGNIRFRTGTLDRWGFQTDGTAEGGANAGSNLQVARYDDAGALIGTVMTFNRATGVAAIQVAGLANGAIVSVDGAQGLTNKTYAGFGATPTTVNMSQRVTGDTQLRWVIDASGTMQWSPGSGTFDSNFGRIAAGIIGTTVEFRSARSSALNIGLSTLVTGDTVPRWQVTAGGVVGYGPGNAAIDGTWSRIQAGGVAWSAVGVTALMDIRTGAVSTNSTLRFSVGSVPRWEIGKNATVEGGGGTQTGSDFEIRAISDNGAATNATITITRANGNVVLPGSLRINGNIGFYNTAPVAKPTVTGSRGGNAALASLLTALAGQGLLTDSSTA